MRNISKLWCVRTLPNWWLQCGMIKNMFYWSSFYWMSVGIRDRIKKYITAFLYINRVKLKCLGLLFFHEEIQVAVIGHSEVALYPWIEVCWFFFSSRYLQLSMAQKSTAQTSFIYCHPFKPESLSLGCLFLSNWTGKKTCQFPDVNKQGQGKSVSHNFTWHLNYSCVCTEEIKNWAEIDWAISPLGPLHSLLSFSV